MRVAFAEHQLPGSCFEDKLALLERLGCEGIDLLGRGLSERSEDILKALKGSIVRPVTLYSALDACLLGATREEREKASGLLRERVELAARLGAFGVIFVPVFGAPRLPDLYPLYNTVVDLEKALLVEILKEIAGYADSLGISLLLEPLCKKETHLVNSAVEASLICRRVGSPALQTMVDFYHMDCDGRDPMDEILGASGFISHVHLSDSNRMPPGDGEVDFTPGIRTLNEIGYSGFYSVECRPFENGEAVERCVKFLRGILGNDSVG